MTRQEKAKKYLNYIRGLEAKIQCYEHEIVKRQGNLLLNGVSYGENVSQTMSGNAQEEGFMALYNMCDKLDTDLIGFVEERSEALESLKKINNPDFVTILYYRYFVGCKFYSKNRNERTVLWYLMHDDEGRQTRIVSQPSLFEMHKRALGAFYAYIPQLWK